ncbi:MAG: DUF4301 family protein [Deltaproteobacteria bacterium]|nr:DUF4301 family protein [Deltaproteobacteria bacterium]
MELLTDADLAWLRQRGMNEAEVRRQLALFATPPAPTALARACTVGDGIRRLDEAEHPALLARWSAAAEAGRLSKFVPASGAASRMFQALVPLLAPGARYDGAAVAAAALQGDKLAKQQRDFVAGLPRFAFFEQLGVPAQPDDAQVLAAVRRLLGPADEGGLDYLRLPKALLAFHRAPDGVRTAFAEHLHEAAGYVRRTRDGVCRLHFTISPAHRAGFDAAAAAAASHAARLGVRFELGFSVQEPYTDTIAVDLENRPFRQDNGELLLRPGGHGALIDNLARLGGDVVYVKNIDNVVGDARRAPTILWKRLLGGLALELEAQAHALEARLSAGEAAALPEALALARGFGATPPAAADMAWALARLRRPLRVCGVVRSQGEPGGGPFWVRDPDGTTSPQIVESAQVDPGVAAQQGIFQGSTHFNPVDLVCCLRDGAGRPHALEDFVDPSAVFLARKSHQGRELCALELPGLWNGAMARWNTVFVEVPAETFAPVKTVLDLLRPEHQP